MSEPTFTITTERIYSRLPDVYRQADTQNDWQLKRFISGIGDQLDAVNELVARFDFMFADEIPVGETPLDFTTYPRYVTPDDPDALPIGQTSDLVDPSSADDAWLPWLAQLVGVKLTSAVPDIQRVQIETASAGWHAGSRQAIINTITPYLTGSQYVGVYDHSTGIPTGTGGQWDVLIVTRIYETPGGFNVATVLADQTPAGVIFHYSTYASSWDTITHDYPTWSTLDPLVWNDIESAP